MPNTINVNAGDGAGIVLQKFFTGRNIHATSASRSYANFDLAPGDLVCLDPYSNTTDHEGKAIGSCVALPTASHLHLPTYVVTAVHPDVNRGVDPGAAIDLTGAGSGAAVNPRAGGWIDVCPQGVVSAYVEGGTDIAVLDNLILTVGTTGSGLVARATLRKIADIASTDTLLEIMATGALPLVKGIALEAYTDTTFVTKKVAFGTLNSCL